MQAIKPIAGWLYDGKSSVRCEANLICDSQGQISFNSVESVSIASVALDLVKVSPRVGNSTRYLDLPDGISFETNENDAIDELLATYNPKRSRGIAHKLESAQKVVISCLLLLVVGGWAFINYGIPLISKQIAMNLPSDASSYIGQGMLEQMDKYFFKPSKLSESRQIEIAEQFEYLSTTFAKQSTELHFRNSPQLGANAFALPDGKVVITDQLVKIANSTDELAMILLHELGHVEQRHILRSTIQSFTMTFLFMAVTGDVSTASSVIGSAPIVFLQAGYSQEMELEADAFAIDYINNGNLTSETFTSMMRKLEASHSSNYRECMRPCSNTGKTSQQCLEQAMDELSEQEVTSSNFGSYLATHPSIKQRIEAFRALQEKPTDLAN